MLQSCHEPTCAPAHSRAPGCPVRTIALIVSPPRVARSPWREAAGKCGKSAVSGWRTVPRNRVLCPPVVVSGGVGYPVAVQLEEIVCRCYQPPLRPRGGPASSHEPVDPTVVFDLAVDRLNRFLRARREGHADQLAPGLTCGPCTSKESSGTGAAAHACGRIRSSAATRIEPNPDDLSAEALQASCCPGARLS